MSLFVVTGLLSCSVVMVWLISSSLLQLLPDEEAITSTVFECDHYNGGVSRLSHGEKKSSTDPISKTDIESWFMYECETFTKTAVWHEVWCVWVFELYTFAAFTHQCSNTQRGKVSKKPSHLTTCYFLLTFLPCAVWCPTPPPHCESKEHIPHMWLGWIKTHWLQRSRDLCGRPPFQALTNQIVMFGLIIAPTKSNNVNEIFDLFPVIYVATRPSGEELKYSTVKTEN